MKTHNCAWPGCTEEIFETTFMCSKHWFNLPWKLRAHIYESYKPGEVTPDFMAAELDVKKFIAGRDYERRGA